MKREMKNLSEKEKKEKENALRNILNAMTNNYKVSEDMSAQKSYILEKAIFIIKLRSIFAKIYDYISSLLTKEERYKLLELIDRVDVKLWKIEKSLPDEYERLLLLQRWNEN